MNGTTVGQFVSPGLFACLRKEDFRKVVGNRQGQFFVMVNIPNSRQCDIFLFETEIAREEWLASRNTGTVQQAIVPKEGVEFR